MTEAVVAAPVDSVWAAFVTDRGLESWMAAHATIDLRIGGTLRAVYDPKARLGDPSTIENTILAYEPLRMLAFRVSNAPTGFPFPSAVTAMWTVIYFEPRANGTTKVREVSMGFGPDEESRKMRAFFDQGNAATMVALQRRFARSGG